MANWWNPVARHRAKIAAQLGVIETFLHSGFVFETVVDAQPEVFTSDGTTPPIIPLFLEKLGQQLHAYPATTPEEQLQACFNASSGLFGSDTKLDETLKRLFRAWTASVRQVDPPRTILTSWVGAIQQTVEDIPETFFAGPGLMNDEAKSALTSLLERAELLRRQYHLDLPHISTTLTHLEIKAARAIGYTFFPLKGLPNSPLTTKEDFDLYAQRSDKTRTLARQILRGDGVILLTGYRGVGKSTFVHAALHEVSGLLAVQADEGSCLPVPIWLNLAKRSTVSQVLRLIVRELYDVLGEEPYQGYLKSDEFEAITFANQRASYNIKQSYQRTLIQSQDTNFGVNVNPGKLLGGPLASVLNVVTLGYKSKNQRKKQFDHSISLMDYDENRAEEDIMNVIHLLRRPRAINGTSSWIKLIFVFDEMDKMDLQEEQLTVISALKNLMLTRDCVFILISGKELYYEWVKARRAENSVLGSYFSTVMNVGMLRSTETAKLVENLIDKSDLGELTDDENNELEKFARYLNFRSKGLPREVLREIREIRDWPDQSLQPYLTTRDPTKLAIIHGYAAIQAALDQLEDRENAQTTGQNSAIAAHLVIDEARYEQVKRGRKVLIEEIIRQGQLDLTQITEIREANFDSVNDEDFTRITDDLKQTLLDVRAEPYIHGPLFEMTPSVGEDVEPSTIVVASQFYSATGITAERSSNSSAELPVSIGDIEVQFGSGQNYQIRRAIENVQRLGENAPETLWQKVYQQLIGNPGLIVKVEAARALNEELFSSVANADEVGTLLDDERDESLRLGVLELIPAESASEFCPVVERLLEEHRSGWEQDELDPLSDTLLNKCLEIYAQAAGGEVFEFVWARLDPDRPLGKSLGELILGIPGASPEKLCVKLIQDSHRSVTDDLVKVLADAVSQIPDGWELVTNTCLETGVEDGANLVSKFQLWESTSVLSNQSAFAKRLALEMISKIDRGNLDQDALVKGLRTWLGSEHWGARDVEWFASLVNPDSLFSNQKFKLPGWSTAPSNADIEFWKAIAADDAAARERVNAVVTEIVPSTSILERLGTFSSSPSIYDFNASTSPTSSPIRAWQVLVPIAGFAIVFALWLVRIFTEETAGFAAIAIGYIAYQINAERFKNSG